jgi:hypothetical protein
MEGQSIDGQSGRHLHPSSKAIIYIKEQILVNLFLIFRRDFSGTPLKMNLPESAAEEPRLRNKDSGGEGRRKPGAAL